MRSSLRVLVVAVVLLVPRVAVGLEITLIEPAGTFGTAGIHFGPNGFRDIFIDGVFQETPWLSNFTGDVRFESGPIVGPTLYQSDPDHTGSRYEFSGGTFTLTAFWSDQFGTPISGRYVAPLLAVLVDIGCEAEFDAPECNSGGQRGMHGTTFVSVGPGVFDRALASDLGIGRFGEAFSFAVLMDGVDGGPSDAFRSFGSPGGIMDLDIPVTVPEPSILSLLLLAPVLGLRLRR